jgi:plasmid stabilization system protein ParE
MRVAWRAAARDDRRRIFRYLAERTPAAAARLVEALILAADGLASFLERGRPGRAPGTSWRPCGTVPRGPELGRSDHAGRPVRARCPG